MVGGAAVVVDLERLHAERARASAGGEGERLGRRAGDGAARSPRSSVAARRAKVWSGCSPKPRHRAASRARAAWRRSYGRRSGRRAGTPPRRRRSPRPGTHSSDDVAAGGHARRGRAGPSTSRPAAAKRARERGADAAAPDDAHAQASLECGRSGSFARRSTPAARVAADRLRGYPRRPSRRVLGLRSMHTAAQRSAARISSSSTGSCGVRALPADDDADQGRVRAGNADADLMFVGEAPGPDEDLQGLPFVGPGRPAARQAARGDRASARGRLHRERPQVPPARQPRPAAGGDRRLQAVPRTGRSS